MTHRPSENLSDPTIPAGGSGKTDKTTVTVCNAMT